MKIEHRVTFIPSTLAAAAGPGIMPDRILAQAGFEEP